MKARHLITPVAALALGFFAVAAGAHDSKWKDRMGSNSLSDEPRGDDAPAIVQVPPSGAPSSGMSTVDPGGNGMAKRDHFDIYSRDENSTGSRRHARGRGHDHEWSSDDMANRDGDHYFAFYGEDIPALKGLQLDVALNRLHHLNQKEIDLAKLAETRAKSEDVLQLAHRIRADHELLEQKVKALADRRDVMLESFQLATFEKAVKDRLDKLSGPEFETAFLRVNDRGHEEAARAMRMVRNDLADTEARNLINEAIPQMMAHMSNAREQNRARAHTEEGTIGE